MPTACCSSMSCMSCQDWCAGCSTRSSKPCSCGSGFSREFFFVSGTVKRSRLKPLPRGFAAARCFLRIGGDGRRRSPAAACPPLLWERLQPRALLRPRESQKIAAEAAPTRFFSSAHPILWLCGYSAPLSGQPDGIPEGVVADAGGEAGAARVQDDVARGFKQVLDRKSTRLNSSH